MSNIDREGSGHVLRTPIWMFAIRVIQFLLAFIILGMSGAIVGDVMIEESAFALALGLLTWIVIAYAVVTEKISRLHSLYHIVAVLSLDGLFIILWLACFAAVAARRSKFRYDVNVDNCFDDGSDFDAVTCNVQRSIEKRAVLFPIGQALMSASAGLGAIEWLLFIATFVWTLVHFLRGRKEGRFPIATSSTDDNYHMESKPYQHQPVATGPQDTTPSAYQPYDQQTTYPPQGYPATHGQEPYGQPAPYGQEYPSQGQQYYAAPQGQHPYSSEVPGSEPYHQSPPYSSPPPQHN